MRITTILTAAAIALAAGVGSAAADENFITLDGISAFEALAGVQAMPLDTDEMASITAADWLRVDTWKGTIRIREVNGHREHYAHGGDDAHGIIYAEKGGIMIDDWYDDHAWTYDTRSSGIHGCIPGYTCP